MTFTWHSSTREIRFSKRQWTKHHTFLISRRETGHRQLAVKIDSQLKHLSINSQLEHQKMKKKN